MKYRVIKSIESVSYETFDLWIVQKMSWLGWKDVYRFRSDKGADGVEKAKEALSIAADQQAIMMDDKS